MRVNFSQMIPIHDLTSEPNDEGSLSIFAKVAEDFLLSQPWCSRIEAGYLGYGLESVLGFFLFAIVPADPEFDDQLWVITGDLPPALFSCSGIPKPSSALQEYVDEMKLWVKAVKAGKPTADLYPVCYRNSTYSVEPTLEFAEMLEGRLHVIEQELIPDAKSQGV